MTNQPDPCKDGVHMTKPGSPYCVDCGKDMRAKSPDQVDALDEILGVPNEMMTSWEIESLLATKAKLSALLVEAQQGKSRKTGTDIELVTGYADNLIRELAEALRLTQEYVGPEVLPPLPGWSWYDALESYKAYIKGSDLADERLNAKNNTANPPSEELEKQREATE
jgi:hypothetical protein